MTFYNMQIHTAYDLLNSTISLDKLYEKLKDDNQQALIISDPNMYAAIKTYRLAKKYGIKIIHSLNVKVDYDLNFLNISLIAKSRRMFYKLLKISSDIQIQDKTIYFEDLLNDLLDYREDCVILVNTDLNSRQSIENLSQLLAEFEHYFSYTEKSFYQVYKGLNNIVYASPAYYLDDEDYKTSLVVRAIANNKKLKIEDLHISSGPNFVKKQEDFKKIIVDIDNPSEKETMIFAMNRQEDLIRSCNYELDFSSYQLPKYIYSEEERAFEQYSTYDYLKYLCVQSLKEKIKRPLDLYIKRLEKELKVIQEMGFEDYFLIVQDFVKYAKSQSIVVGYGRGSAAGSLVCYLLGITQADPIKYNLLFERFLNKDRISMPDIDIDFQDTRRDEVIKYVEEKYGVDRVAQIIVFGSFQAKAAARETARIFNFHQKKLDFISKNVSSRRSLTESYEESKELKEFVNASKQHQYWFSVAKSIENLPKNKSVHAAGLIISGQDMISDYIALEKANITRNLSQWTMDDLEYVGLLKIDFLGIKYLTMLENISKDIRKENPDFDIDKVSYDDQNVYKLFTKGDTEGIFQFENRGLRAWLRELKPTEFKDIYAITSLYRPGPMKYVASYIARKHGKEKVSYLHPVLETILKETYGIIVYQEQIMQIAVSFAGMTLNQADTMRKAVSKKDRLKLQEYGEIFIEKAVAKGQDANIASKLYEQIVTFAEYGFNKSHAVVYSMLAYKLAYLKTYHKKYFMTELLNNVISDVSKINEYKSELNRNKISLLSPNVNESDVKFSVVRKGISFALLAIKHVGYMTAVSIVNERDKYGKFLDIDDFLRRLDKKLDYQAANFLVKSGALDCFAYNRATLLNKVKNYYEDARRNVGDIRFAINSLSSLTIKVEEVEDFSLLEKISMEKEATGTYFLKHPVQVKKEEYSYLPLEYISKKNVDVYVEIVSVKEIKTKKGDAMAFLSVNDGNEDYEITVFPDTYKYARLYLKNNSFLVISIKQQVREGKISYILEKITDFESYENYCLSNIKQISVLVNEKNKKFLQRALHPSNKGNVHLFNQKNQSYNKTFIVKNEHFFVREYLNKFEGNSIKISYKTV
ncbi:DNA polymerase III subunit alpha [Gemella sp. 19428wG2_WT2a]|nr:DNA polymerase III subunit alpha [Gemella sp. 19428wG2_WT2a]TFU59990.1 DNA polymerase III subunit alpha [Gemella sp. WT2a]